MLWLWVERMDPLQLLRRLPPGPAPVKFSLWKMMSMCIGTSRALIRMGIPKICPRQRQDTATFSCLVIIIIIIIIIIPAISLRYFFKLFFFPLRPLSFTLPRPWPSASILLHIVAVCLGIFQVAEFNYKDAQQYLVLCVIFCYFYHFFATFLDSFLLPFPLPLKNEMTSSPPAAFPSHAPAKQKKFSHYF